jgi:hypothetical protein
MLSAGKKEKEMGKEKEGKRKRSERKRNATPSEIKFFFQGCRSVRGMLLAL